MTRTSIYDYVLQEVANYLYDMGLGLLEEEALDSNYEAELLWVTDGVLTKSEERQIHQHLLTLIPSLCEEDNLVCKNITGGVSGDRDYNDELMWLYSFAKL